MNQVDLNATPLLGQQQIRELASDFIVLDDVGLQVDMVTGGTDRGKHRAVGGCPILQQDDLVAHDQRTADDGLFQRNLLVENIDVAGLAFQIGDDRSVLLRREGATRILEPGRLPGILIDERIGIGQRSATCRKEQEGCQPRNQFMKTNCHD